MGKGSKRRPENPKAIAAHWPWKPPVLKAWDPATGESRNIYDDPQLPLGFEDAIEEFGLPVPASQLQPEAAVEPQDDPENDYGDESEEVENPDNPTI